MGSQCFMGTEFPLGNLMPLGCIHLNVGEMVSFMHCTTRNVFCKPPAVRPATPLFSLQTAFKPVTPPSAPGSSSV